MQSGGRFLIMMESDLIGPVFPGIPGPLNPAVDPGAICDRPIGVYKGFNRIISNTLTITYNIP